MLVVIDILSMLEVIDILTSLIDVLSMLVVLYVPDSLDSRT